ncbi:MAG: 50S ribosomal protein L11 methyltransferase [Novosphingobium sp.]
MTLLSRAGFGAAHYKGLMPVNKPEKLTLQSRPQHFLKLGLRLVSSGQGRQALDLVDKTRRERPDDRLLGELSKAIMVQRVPEFHDAMLRDKARNAAYRRAIEAAAPGKRVLDIGTGSGLLAMMAARAGATHVYACEVNPMIAATAREIIAANGLSRQITVLPMYSGKLDRNHDLEGGVDLVVSEIFADDLLGEGVLPALAHARAKLCRPGAVILPGAATIRVALVEVADDRADMGLVEGFDLTLFKRHIPRTHNFDPASSRLVMRSTAADLFAFDFEHDLPLARRASANVTANGGRATGIIQWITLGFDDGGTYENAPGGDGLAHWMVRYCPFDAPRETVAGSDLTISGWHNDSQIAFWLTD